MADDESNKKQNVTDEKKNTNSKDDENVKFYFLYDIIKKKILRRHKIGDVCVLSSWLKALEQSKDKTIRYDYMQLMVLALDYPEPVCPFKDPPPPTLDPLEHGVIETARRFINREGTATCTPIDSYVSSPPITASVAHNKCRFASSQIIPNVGAQVYYAYSDEPLYRWYIPPQITVPKKGPHAGPLEWERAIAGILPESNALRLDNIKILNTQTNVNENKSDRIIENEKPDICNVMNIEQQNRNVTENFGWDDASILTGEKIIGAEMCSDNKMEGQVKSQNELDQEAISVHDKLYPGDFKIHVDYSVVDGIIPTNMLISMEGIVGIEKRNKNEQHSDLRLTRDQLAKCDEKCSSKVRQCSPPRDACADSRKNMLNASRQTAGQESTWLSVDCSPKSTAEAKIRRRKISKLSAYLADLTAKSQKYKTRTNVDPDCPNIVVGSPENEFSQRCVANEFVDDPESSNGRKCVPQEDLLQSEIDCSEESLYDAAKYQPQNNSKEPENTEQNH